MIWPPHFFFVFIFKAKEKICIYYCALMVLSGNTIHFLGAGSV